VQGEGVPSPFTLHPSPFTGAQRPKLLHINSACTVGGAEAHVLALLAGLDPARYVRWLAYFEERPDEARPMLADFQAIGVRTVDLRGHGQLDPLAVLRLARLMRRQRFDLVHTHSLRAELAAVAAVCLVRPRPRVIRSVHNTDEFYQRPPTAWLARLSARRLDHLVAISDAVARHVLDHTGLSPERVTRIYYGLDPAPYQRSGNVAPPRPGPIIGMIARLAPQKGHTVLLDALPALVARFPALLVEFVGHEHLTTIAELRAYAEQRGVADRVSFVGFRDDLPELLAGWDLMVLPSLWEGFGLVLLEAMAAGCPVVASNVGPIPEVVVHGETGLLVEPSQPDRLAAAIGELLEHPDLARRMGEAGRRRVAEQFSLDRMLSETERLYAKLLAPGSRPARETAQASPRNPLSPW
jgi:glycosyltransferase involved in cell wall biosynthesis